ncbi:MAG: hypothetical protein JWN34_1257 [Bryobacterales bacterium]|jgi:hypothetical protein|nr:hypothetical protein [Bryobacterales bacterium]
MKLNRNAVVTLAIVCGSSLYAQPGYQRNASMVGGGNAEFGKCTIEVVVDGMADVEIRGNTGVFRNVVGQPAQWRRFECSSPLPQNPVNFNFAGVDGRGRQSLIRDPRNGGVAAVHIEDTAGGSEGYTFDLTWGNRGSNNQPGNVVDNRGNYPAGNSRDPRYDQNQNDQRYRPNYRDSDYYRRYNHGFASDEAVRVCQNEIERQALTRFRRADVHFDRARLDDGPGQQDAVVGIVDIHRQRGTERYRFSCAVDFNSGRVRTATLDASPLNDRDR